MTLSYSPPSMPDHDVGHPPAPRNHARHELRTSVNLVNFGAAR